MNNRQLLLLQRRLAQLAVGASAARRMGPKGTVEAARDYLQTIELSALSDVQIAAFPQFLDSRTVDLLSALPLGARHWGAARKFLNLFLRDVIYSRHLCDALPLVRLESALELPLDSHVALALQSEAEGKCLPVWNGVTRLIPEVSREFQEIASMVARRLGCPRIHLDLEYWRREKKANKAPEPTPGSVTPRADARVAPAPVVAHL